MEQNGNGKPLDMRDWAIRFIDPNGTEHSVQADELIFAMDSEAYRVREGDTMRDKFQKVAGAIEEVTGVHVGPMTAGEILHRVNMITRDFQKKTAPISISGGSTESAAANTGT